MKILKLVLTLTLTLIFKLMLMLMLTMALAKQVARSNSTTPAGGKSEMSRAGDHSPGWCGHLLRHVHITHTRLREGSGPRLPNRMNFRKNSKRPLTSPSFSENHIANFFMIYARRYDGQYGFRGTFFKVCLVLIFLKTIVEKHTLNPEITILHQFHDQTRANCSRKVCEIESRS